MNSLHVEVISTFAKLWSLGPEWRELERVCATDLPFQTWEWSTSWWSYLHEDAPGVRDSLRVCAIRAETGELVGIAPFMITERPSLGPIRLRILQFIGADPNITELRSMLSQPAREEDCYEALRIHLDASAAEWDWIAWEGVRPHIGNGDRFVDRFSSVQEKAALVLELAPTWEVFKSNLGRNIKESLRKCYNSLKRDGLTYRLQVLDAPGDIDSALDNFFHLHTARARLDGTVSHPDVFEQPRSREFLTQVCHRLAIRGVARIFQLWVDDRLVATRVGFIMHETLYLYYSGWHPGYARYSVMTTLLAEVIKFAIGEGLANVHLSTGVDVSKTRWGAREVRYVSGPQLSPGSRAQALRFIYELFERIQSSEVARGHAPAFLFRGANAPSEPQARVPASVGTLRLLVATIGALLALDLFDGRLDGMVNLFPALLG